MEDDAFVMDNGSFEGAQTSLERVISATRGYRQALQTFSDAVADQTREVRSLGESKLRRGGVVADYVGSLGTIRALVRAAKVLPEVLVDDETYDDQTVAGVLGGMIETAGEARERLTGQIGELIETETAVIAADTRLKDLAVTEKAAGRASVLAYGELENKAHFVEHFLAGYPAILDRFQQEWQALNEGLAAARRPRNQAKDAYDNQNDILAALVFPGQEILDDLNALAAVRMDNPDRPGKAPLGVLNPREAAEWLMDLNTELDENTRQQLLDTLDTYHGAIAATTAALDVYLQALATYRQQASSLLDGFEASLESLIGHL